MSHLIPTTGQLLDSPELAILHAFGFSLTPLASPF